MLRSGRTEGTGEGWVYPGSAHELKKQCPPLKHVLFSGWDSSRLHRDDTIEIMNGRNKCDPIGEETFGVIVGDIIETGRHHWDRRRDRGNCQDRTS